MGVIRLSNDPKTALLEIGVFLKHNMERETELYPDGVDKRAFEGIRQPVEFYFNLLSIAHQCKEVVRPNVAQKLILNLDLTKRSIARFCSARYRKMKGVRPSEGAIKLSSNPRLALWQIQDYFTKNMELNNQAYPDSANNGECDTFWQSVTFYYNLQGIAHYCVNS